MEEVTVGQGGSTRVQLEGLIGHSVNHYGVGQATAVLMRKCSLMTIIFDPVE